MNKKRYLWNHKLNHLKSHEVVYLNEKGKTIFGTALSNSMENNPYHEKTFEYYNAFCVGEAVIYLKTMDYFLLEFKQTNKNNSSIIIK